MAKNSSAHLSHKTLWTLWIDLALSLFPFFFKFTSYSLEEPSDLSWKATRKPHSPPSVTRATSSAGAGGSKIISLHSERCVHVIERERDCFSSFSLGIRSFCFAPLQFFSDLFVFSGALEASSKHVFQTTKLTSLATHSKTLYVCGRTCLCYAAQMLIKKFWKSDYQLEPPPQFIS